MIIGDADEFPSRSVISLLKWCDFQGVLGLHTRNFFYYWDCDATEMDFLKATKVHDYNWRSFNKIRTAPNQARVEYAGWHISYFYSNPEEMKKKMERFAHQELNRPDINDPNNIIRTTSECRIHFNGGSKMELYRDASFFPEPVVEAPERYRRFLRRDLTTALRYCRDGKPQTGFSQELWVGRTHRLGCCPDTKIEVLSARWGAHRGCAGGSCFEGQCFVDHTKHFQGLCNGRMRCSSLITIDGSLSRGGCNVSSANSFRLTMACVP